jgi:hypothetical protein
MVDQFLYMDATFIFPTWYGNALVSQSIRRLKIDEPTDKIVEIRYRERDDNNFARRSSKNR